MCSAPGVKTTHLAAIMKNKGKIYAVERDQRRYQTLTEMVATAGATIVQTINKDVLDVSDEDVPNVEYVLLDPSCSGSGMLNRFESETANKDTGRLYKLAGLQHKLLLHAMTSFPNVHTIVYSTCSIYSEENEQVVLGALRKIGNFKLCNASELLKNKWKNFGSKEFAGIAENVIYARTEDDLTNGFFVAVIVRCEEGELNEFYVQKQEHLEVQSAARKAVDKRGIDNEAVNEDEKVEGDISESASKKIKKKWKNKNYNQ